MAPSDLAVYWYTRQTEPRPLTRPRPSMTGLAIPTLPARDLDASIAFYTALGFDCPFHQDAPDGYAILAHNDGRELHLFRHDEIDPLTNYAGCYWRVSDVDAVYRQAAGSGVELRGEPTVRPWGMREFALVDPSGNLLRIGQQVTQRAPAR